MHSSAGDTTCKVLLLGNGSVGKSSIIARFVADGFSKSYKQTVGLDFFEKRLVLKDTTRLLLQVWDIGGQSVSSPMLTKYIFASRVVFLCYDVTDPQSFADVEDWQTLVTRASQTTSSIGSPSSSSSLFSSSSSSSSRCPPAVYLVGNKVDLVPQRLISDVQHETYIRHNALAGGFLVSAANGDHVLSSFYQVAAKVAGVTLTEYDLAFTERVIHAVVSAPRDEGRTAMADAIEAEDAKHEAEKLQGCHCCVQ